MVLVIHELEVLVLVGENARRAAADHQLRQRERRARELQVRLLEMIQVQVAVAAGPDELAGLQIALLREQVRDRKSTRLNSSHGYISYAVFCLKKKKTNYKKIISRAAAHRISLG